MFFMNTFGNRTIMREAWKGTCTARRGPPDKPVYCGPRCLRHLYDQSKLYEFQTQRRRKVSAILFRVSFAILHNNYIYAAHNSMSSKKNKGCYSDTHTHKKHRKRI